VNSIYDQSAVIPFRIKKRKIEVLLITSISSGKWIFPKGIIEEDLTAQESAAKEALEEAGVEGEVLDILIGEYSYKKWGGTCHVRVFPLRVEKVYDQWVESEDRERRWTSLGKSINLVSKRDLKTLIKKFEGLVSSF